MGLPAEALAKAGDGQGEGAPLSFLRKQESLLFALLTFLAFLAAFLARAKICPLPGAFCPVLFYFLASRF